MLYEPYSHILKFTDYSQFSCIDFDLLTSAADDDVCVYLDRLGEERRLEEE